MGDGLKISKDKRHRSSSSLAGVILEGTRSERKLDIRASIPEVDDQFALAEERCDDLQEKIDLVKALKRKRKLKKKSMTRMNEPQPAENVPFITVRTQPKKKVSQQATTRIRRLEVPPNPTRGYLDPATVEQHRMLGQVRTYGHSYRQPRQEQNKEYASGQKSYKSHSGWARADGDGMGGQGVQMMNAAPLEVACGQDEVTGEFSDSELFDQRHDAFKQPECPQSKSASSRRRHVPRDVSKEMVKRSDDPAEQEAISSPSYRRRTSNRQQQNLAVGALSEERPVVELFNKNRTSPPADARRQIPLPAAAIDKRTKNVIRESPPYDGIATDLLEEVLPAELKKGNRRYSRRIKYRSRRYELPTVASQMKQAGMRYYYGSANHTNIPFVVSKSTAPSHNIGVNIQQNMSLDNREINVIKLGSRMLRLPSYKYMSYSRLLSLYREGDGMVPRFLRAISRPHYFYTSMYNLSTNRDDFDGATSKGRAGSQDAKQSLAAYATLYREYEQVEKCLKENYEPELERRKEELSRELASREEHIRKVVQDYRAPAGSDQILRASASTAEDYRHSTHNKLKVGDQ